MLTVAEVATRLKCHPHTVRRWIWSGRLRAVKIGNMTRILEEEVERLVKPAEANFEQKSETPEKGPVALLATMRALRKEGKEGDYELLERLIAEGGRPVDWSSPID